MAIEIVSSVASPAASAVVDGRTPLWVAWDVDPYASPLYLFDRDPRQGYVELKVHPVSGALLGMVVIDLPRPIADARVLPGGSARDGAETAVLDLDRWPWEENPDYREPARNDIRIVCDLGVSASSERITIWFSAHPVARVLQAGVVEIGVSADDELVAISESGWVASRDELSRGADDHREP